MKILMKLLAKKFFMSEMINYTFFVVCIGTTLLGITSGAVGSLIVLKKESLLADAIAHSALIGVLISYLITGKRELELLLVGAFVSSLFSSIIIKEVVKKSKIKYDTALAIVIAIFFGLAIVILTFIQKTPLENKAGLENFIYGEATSMTLRDVKIIALFSMLILLVIIFNFSKIKIVIFESDYATVIGINTKIIQILLNFLIILGIIIGIQSVGVILVSAIMVAPTLVVRKWIKSLKAQVVLSGLVGGVSAIVGTVLSVMLEGIPTGPLITVVLSVTVFVSLIFKGRG